MRRPLLLASLLACAPPEGPAPEAAAPDAGAAAPAPCPPQMALVPAAAGAVCVDRYEAALTVARSGGGEEPWPYYAVIGDRQARAVVAEGQRPQGYISGLQAQAACRRAGKRLCTLPEWLAACQGPRRTTYPYGDTYVPGACNEGRRQHPVVELFGPDPSWSTAEMNDPRLDQLPGTVSPGGAFPRCVSAHGVYDLHGNLHEWIDAENPSGTGTFKGGFFVDARINGAGCLYRTIAHKADYHDYSTGFRCCTGPRP